MTNDPTQKTSDAVEAMQASVKHATSDYGVGAPQFNGQIAITGPTPFDIDAAIPITGVDVAGFDDPLVRGHMPLAIAGEITIFVEHRMKPSAFLCLMLEGDFVAARFGAHAAPDDMPIIAYWIWRYAPRESFGSPEAVNAWIGGQR